MKHRPPSAAVVAVATVVALASSWHSGRHMWRLLGAEGRAYGSYSATDSRRAALTQIEMPGDIFDWYAQYVVHGDRAYYQVLPGGFSHDFDLPAIFGYAARYYLLPAVETTDLAHATIVISYHEDPGLLHVRFITQQRAGLQPIFVSRIRSP